MARVASKLLKIQRMGMICVAPMRHHTPTAGLETILGLPPLDLYIQSPAATTFHRLNLQPRNWEGVAGTKKGHIKWIESQVSNLPHSSLQDRCISTHWNRKFNTTTGDGTDIIHDKGLLCYTDGSGQGTGSGSGIAAYLDDKLDPIYTDSAYTGSATVFQAELHAIHMACEYALMQPHRTVNILSDSQAAIKAATIPLIKSRTVLNTVNSLNKLAASGKNVSLRWVKAHNDIDGNELADILAKQGAALQLSGPEPFLLLSHAVCKQTYKYELKSYCNAKGNPTRYWT
jgi:ribonuclease HI